MTTKSDTWAGYVKSYLACGDFSGNTLRSYQTALVRFLFDVSPWANNWEGRAIQWKGQLNKDMSARSVSHRITCVRSFLKWCQGMGYITRNPMLAVKVRVGHGGGKRALTNIEVQKLLNISSTTGSLAGEERAARDRSMLMLMLYTGLRITGARMLDLEDFEERDKFMVAHYVRKGHAEKDAFVIVPEVVMAGLRSYLNAGGRSFEDDIGPLFISGMSDIPRVSDSGMRRAINRRFVEAGIVGPGITVHTLRHTAATRAKRSGASIKHIQKMLGHENPATTEIYLHDLDRMNNPAEMEIDYGEEGNSE